MTFSIFSKNFSKKIALLALVPAWAFANEGAILDTAPIDVHNQVSLQRGAQTFANYCLSCHSVSAARFSGLTEIGLSEAQIKQHLMLAGEKVNDPMRVAMPPKDAKAWFGATPPDLSVVARARGADWLYTYLRTFYRDDTRPTGWNNLAFPKVGMPHALWQLQGDQVLTEKTFEEETEAYKALLELPLSAGKKHIEAEKENGKVVYKVKWLAQGETKGALSATDFDTKAADLTNFLVWMSEPHQVEREQLGYIVMFFILLILLPVVYFTKREIWKDIH